MHIFLALKKRYGAFYYWAPALFWMVLIFTLSSKQRIAVSPQYWANFFVFKSLHVIEYAALFGLLLRAIAGGKKPTHTQYLYAFIFSVLYAISDELHQTFVPTREGTLRDVLIDTTGITLAYLTVKKLYHKLQLFFV